MCCSGLGAPVVVRHQNLSRNGVSDLHTHNKSSRAESVPSASPAQNSDDVGVDLANRQLGKAEPVREKVKERMARDKETREKGVIFQTGTTYNNARPTTVPRRETGGSSIILSSVSCWLSSWPHGVLQDK